MANRHLARSTVLQTLFEWDFRHLDLDTAKEALTRNLGEFAPGMNDSAFVDNLLGTVVGKYKDLDNIIEKAAPEWPIEKISVVDRNVLRIGLAELLFSDRKEVPPKVAINEAIELAKAFGGETSGKFVNGVLGAVYKEMGEPGKDEVSTKKKNPKDIPDEKAPIEQLGGAVIYCIKDEQIHLALVHDVFGHWTLSKGHLNEGEDLKTGIARCIQEELGIEVTIEEEVGKNEYIAFDPEKGKIRKQVVYYLAETPYRELLLKQGGGLDGARWFPLADLAELNFYDDVLPLVTKAINVLAGKYTPKK